MGLKNSEKEENVLYTTSKHIKTKQIVLEPLESNNHQGSHAFYTGAVSPLSFTFCLCCI